MTIRYHSGDIFDNEATHLCIPVNLVGVMGAGLAKTAKNRSPGYYLDYRRQCHTHELRRGVVTGYYCRALNKTLVSVPTKEHYRDDSTLELVEASLMALVEYVKLNKVKRMAMPLLGCGLGKLNHLDVNQLIRDQFSQSSCDITVYVSDALHRSYYYREYYPPYMATLEVEGLDDLLNLQANKDTP